MESEVVRRRIHKIAGHFVPPTNDDIISSTTHLLPMNCSSSLNSVIRRCDNRMYFARQASSAQGCFMRQSSSEQSPCNGTEAPLFGRPSLSLKCSGSTNEGSCNASEAPLFARPSLSLKCSGFTNKGSFDASEVPMFSRPARMESNKANFAPLVQDCKLFPPDLPKFAKPDQRIRQKEQFRSKKKAYSSEPKGLDIERHEYVFLESRQFDCSECLNSFQACHSHIGIEWSPRMDVKELGCNYVMIIEVPGVGINDIRVEVDNQNLTVIAERAKSCRVTGRLNSSISAYNRGEYREDPYQVVWPLPTDVNKDTISAEFLNGLLQIIIPKL